MGGICRSGLVSSRQEGRCNAGRGVAVRWGVAPDVYTQAVYTHHWSVGEMLVEGASLRLGLTLSSSFKCVASSLFN